MKHIGVKTICRQKGDVFQSESSATFVEHRLQRL